MLEKLLLGYAVSVIAVASTLTLVHGDWTKLPARLAYSLIWPWFVWALLSGKYND